MAEPQEHDETAENPSQHPAARRIDRAVLGKTPQTALIRIMLFVVLFIVVFGSLFYLLNGQ